MDDSGCHSTKVFQRGSCRGSIWKSIISRSLDWRAGRAPTSAEASSVDIRDKVHGRRFKSRISEVLQILTERCQTELRKQFGRERGITRLGEKTNVVPTIITCFTPEFENNAL